MKNNTEEVLAAYERQNTRLKIATSLRDDFVERLQEGEPVDAKITELLDIIVEGAEEDNEIIELHTAEILTEFKHKGK